MTNLAEPTLPAIEGRFCDYYYALKKVYRLHIENGFGESPDIPSGFSEALCRQVLGLTTCEGRTYDAVDDEGLRYEIKATGSAAGKTSMSKSNEFDVLIWLLIDFENDVLCITKMPRALFTLEDKRERKSVRLLSIARKHQLSYVTYPFTQQNACAVASLGPPSSSGSNAVGDINVETGSC